MLAKRIIPCLDVANGRVVKGKKFLNLQDKGDPVELARQYVAQGADELTFLDVTASKENRDTQYSWVAPVAEVLNIPFTVGGGIRDSQSNAQTAFNWRGQNLFVHRSGAHTKSD